MVNQPYGTNFNTTTGQFEPLGGYDSSSSFSSSSSGLNTGQNLQDLISKYMKFVQNPTASPLYQNQLSGLLAALAPGEAQQRQNLGDVFRGAGNMSSGIYGNAQTNLISQQGLNRQQLASQLLGQMFPQMTQALMGPISLEAQLRQAMQAQQASAGRSGGGSGGGGSYGGSPSTPTMGYERGQVSPVTPGLPGAYQGPNYNPQLEALLQALSQQSQSATDPYAGGTTEYMGGGQGGSWAPPPTDWSQWNFEPDTGSNYVYSEY